MLESDLLQTRTFSPLKMSIFNHLSRSIVVSRFLLLLDEYHIRTLDQESPIEWLGKEAIVGQESINHFVRYSCTARKYGPTHNCSRHTTIDGACCSYNGVVINCWLTVVESGKKQIHFKMTLFQLIRCAEDDDDIFRTIY